MREKSGPTEDDPNETPGDSSGKSKKFSGKKSPHSHKTTKLPSCSLPANMVPTFYVGGGNGTSLVEAPLLALGWKRTTDKYDERYRLKWVECKSRINYGAFKEGEQLVNHLPNAHLLTNKLGLLNSLQEYERVTLSTKGRPPRLKMADFHPETYRMDEKNDRETFLTVYKENEMWICKPTGMNQGKGIFLIRSREEINRLLEEREQRKAQPQKPGRPLMSRIVQRPDLFYPRKIVFERYITNPLLLEGRKFDIRSYMLIASTVPFLVLYHKGYIRLSCNKYDGDDQNLVTHLTNQFVQKKVPNYKDLKEDTAWTMDKFNQYINEHVKPEKDIEEDWVYNTLTKQMQKIMIHCFNSVKHKLQGRIGFFDLFGLDFMVDTDMKLSLIEVNVNPALHCNCEALKDVIPGVVEESLYISIECFEKARKNQPLMPLQTLKTFTILYCGTRPNVIVPRQTRSVSPVKENTAEKSKLTATAAAIRRPSPSRPVHRVLTQSTPLVPATQLQPPGKGAERLPEPNSARIKVMKDNKDVKILQSEDRGREREKTGHVYNKPGNRLSFSLNAEEGDSQNKNQGQSSDQGQGQGHVVSLNKSNSSYKTSFPLIMNTQSALASASEEKSETRKNSVVESETESGEVGSPHNTLDSPEKAEISLPKLTKEEEEFNKLDPLAKANMLLARTSDSLSQATNTIGRISITLNQVGVSSESILDEVKLKMTHGSMGSANQRDRENLERGN